MTAPHTLSVRVSVCIVVEKLTAHTREVIFDDFIIPAVIRLGRSLELGNGSILKVRNANHIDDGNEKTKTKCHNQNYLLLQGKLHPC